MANIIVTGVLGRMGRLIATCVLERSTLKLVGATEQADHPGIDQDLGELLGKGKLGISVSSDLDNIIGPSDVIIDFTAPTATLKHLNCVQKHKKAIVIGTTALSTDDKKNIQKAGENIGVVMAPNMSIGVNLLFNLLGDVAKKLGEEYDIEITEKHHKFKKDAPSGTAVRMAEIVAEARGKNLDDVVCYGRKGLVGERKKGEISIHAIRAGDIIGEHTVTFGGMGERVELTHIAHSRETFVRGAIFAAEFISKKKNGFFTMQDILKGM